MQMSTDIKRPVLGGPREEAPGPGSGEPTARLILK